MSADIPTLAEALVEDIRRLKLQIATLHERLIQQEAAAAMRRGTLQDDVKLEHTDLCNVSTNAPPSAPPHGEPSHE